MTKQFCDMCGHDLVEHSMEDLFGSRKITVQFEDVNSGNEKKWSLTLCNSCKGKMFYLVSNPVVLEKHISDMGLLNRVRYLFRKKIDTEVENEKV